MSQKKSVILASQCTIIGREGKIEAKNIEDKLKGKAKGNLIVVVKLLEV
jgi:hypothetical protein